MTKLIRMGATGAFLALIAASAVAGARQAESPFWAEATKQSPRSGSHASSATRSRRATATAGESRKARNPLVGSASYYANRFHGRKTASGHPYRKDAMTAAHRTLPLGTWVRVTNTRNNQSVVVQITDRGPYRRGRIIDVSRAAATQLGMLHSGTAPVNLDVLDQPEWSQPTPDPSTVAFAFN